MKASICILLVALTIAGCDGRERHSALQGELQNVGVCFFDAVSVLQNEPAEGANLAAFLADARDNLPPERSSRFALLHWDSC